MKKASEICAGLLEIYHQGFLLGRSPVYAESPESHVLPRQHTYESNQGELVDNLIYRGSMGEEMRCVLTEAMSKTTSVCFNQSIILLLIPLSESS
jgi:hypothetical protein